LPDVYEAEKERQLKESKEGKGHWNDELASNSEASVWTFRPKRFDTSFPS